METLKTKLRQLKLAGMVKTIESRNIFALEKKVTYIDFMELLLEDESVNRSANSFSKRLNRSKLDTQKGIDNFDFNYQPELEKTKILDLAACRFITEKKNIILMGKPGVGKTHLANAIGVEAIKKGYKVLFLHVNDLIDKFNTANADGTRINLMNELTAADLIILDEIGFKKLPSESIDDFFEVIRKRYEKGSIIITTNRNFEDWGAIFGDYTMASAIIDRIIHHA
ncbi:MAG: ATP-binding protein, partial [Flavobacteriia bacterium]|nr:ATP-binding protein [Flavobacteriia bacterium]